MIDQTTMPRRSWFAVIVAALTLAGCAPAAPDAAPSPVRDHAVGTQFLVEQDLDGLDAAQIIKRLDTMPVADRPAGLIASVRPAELVLTDGQGREERLPMPDDKVYVSVAPYREQTHDCYFHSLTTCLGELANTEVQVILTDESGEVLINEIRQTFDNGFLGFWIPRGITATLTIEHEIGAGTAAISTVSEDDPTCITTLQLT